MPEGKINGQNDMLASVEFPGVSAGGNLHSKLEELQGYLGRHRERLLAIRERADFQLRIGWSPMSPQESLVFPASLISGLAELGVDIMLDGYGS